MMKAPKIKYFLNLSNACMMASISLSYKLKLYSTLVSFQLLKIIGYPFYIKTSPTPNLEESHSIVKGIEKFGIAIGAHNSLESLKSLPRLNAPNECILIS